MKTKWIIENFVKEKSYSDLCTEIKRQGFDLQEISKDFKLKDISQYNAKYPVIFNGSIEMTKLIKSKLHNCSPVSFCSFDNYLCSKYMSYFGKYLFNDRYAIISLGELHRQKFLFYGTFGKEALIFIRPDSGDKPFQSQLLDLIDLDRFVENHKDLLHKLVVISSPKNILWEGRFIVTKYKEIIAYSTYRYQGQTTKIPIVPSDSIDFCNKLLDIDYCPDPIFCIDICSDNDNNYWLLEINSFSSAGLYECNKQKIVKRVSEIAEEEWKLFRSINCKN